MLYNFGSNWFNLVYSLDQGQIRMQKILFEKIEYLCG
jgi:hypothetical protein